MSKAEMKRVETGQPKNGELEMKMQNSLLKLCMDQEREKIFEYDIEQDFFVLRKFVDGELTTVTEIENYQTYFDGNNAIYEKDLKKVERIMEVCKSTATAQSIDVRKLRDDGGYDWLRCYFVGVADDSGEVKKLVGRIRTITDDMEKRHEYQKLAERDQLTGIYNCAVLLQKAAEDLEEKKSGKCAVITIDLDDFRRINEVFGHDKGDEVLHNIAQSLREYIEGRGLVGRVGGDRFVLFLSDIADESEVRKEIEDFRAILASLSSKTQITVSVGCVIKNRDNLDIQDIYQEADKALYEAKRKGTNSLVLYNSDTDWVNPIQENDFSTYVEEEDVVLEEYDGYVSVVDVETMDVLYLSKSLYKDIASRDGEFDWRTKKCFEVLCGCKSPCETCEMRDLEKEKAMYYFKTNPQNKQYFCRASMIDWHGKKARMEIAYDVSTSQDIYDLLKGRFEVNDVLEKGIKKITKHTKFDNSYNATLRFVAQYYGAERSLLFELNHEEQPVMHEWHNEHMESWKEVIDEQETQHCYQKLKEYANSQKRILIEEIDFLKEEEPKEYKRMSEHQVWSIYGIMLEKNQKEIGCIVVINPKLHVGEISLMSIFSTFLTNEIARKKLWDKQEYELTHDPHTGTFNRNSYMTAIENVKDAKSIGLATIDINNMKRINNDFGFEYGNRMVREIADILKEAFSVENVYRFNSDEFTVVCLNEDRDVFAARVEKARKLFEAHETGACIGYVWDDFEMDVRRMLEHAEELLKLEKDKFHESPKGNPKSRVREISDGLQKKIESGYFQVYLQPKICMSNKEYYGAEALIRAVDPEKGLIPPGRFIPVLEKTGTIRYIDFFVFEEVCKLIHEWKQKGIPIVPISFNFSRITLLGTDLIKNVVEIVEKYDIPRSALEIEITETIGDLEYDMIAKIANGLRKEGFRLSMDDFGTKYSSISILSIMKFDILKIDRSMVNDLEQSEISRKVMNHVIAMCQDLGIECIAEGVETEEQADLLQHMDCMIAQGYLYGKPMPMKEYETKYIESLKRRKVVSAGV